MSEQFYICLKERRYTPTPTRKQKSCIKSSVKENKNKKQKTKTKPGPSLVFSDPNSKSLQGIKIIYERITNRMSSHFYLERKQTKTNKQNKTK